MTSAAGLGQEAQLSTPTSNRPAGGKGWRTWDTFSPHIICASYACPDAAAGGGGAAPPRPTHSLCSWSSITLLTHGCAMGCRGGPPAAADRPIFVLALTHRPHPAATWSAGHWERPVPLTQLRGCATCGDWGEAGKGHPAGAHQLEKDLAPASGACLHPFEFPLIERGGGGWKE